MGSLVDTFSKSLTHEQFEGRGPIEMNSKIGDIVSDNKKHFPEEMDVVNRILLSTSP